MKNILIILGLIVSFSNILLAQSTVTFAQDFRRLSNVTLVVAVQANENIELEVVTTTRNFVTVDVSVDSPNSKKGVLTYLKNSGRYYLKLYEHNDIHTSYIAFLYDADNVVINGKPINEKIVITIHVPQDIHCIQKRPKAQPSAPMFASR